MLSNLSSHAGELKSQGAAEAARDPNSDVTSEDAERTMIDESTKAGAIGFQFDPNATAEEKAAQAHTVSVTEGIPKFVVTRLLGSTSRRSLREKTSGISSNHRYCMYQSPVHGVIY